MSIEARGGTWGRSRGQGWGQGYGMGPWIRTKAVDTGQGLSGRSMGWGVTKDMG